MIELVKREDLLALAATFRSVDFAAKLRLTLRPSKPHLHFTDEPSVGEERFGFYDRIMREVPRPKGRREARKELAATAR